MNALVHIHVLFLYLFRLIATQDEADVGTLSHLPFSELLAHKRMLEGTSEREGAPMALALVGEPSQEEMRLKGLRHLPAKKTFYEEDYEDEKGHLTKKKHKDKLHDVFNTSIMALSYLAFGGYLLCMIASALREKRRRYTMAYSTAGPTTSNQFAQVLQQYMNHRPLRPFIRFPAVTVHQGGKRRRRRLAKRDARQDGTPLINVIDYVDDSLFW